MEKKIFLTRRYSNDIYKLIIDICLKDAIKTQKEKLDLEIIKIKKQPNFKFLFYCFGLLLLGYFFNEKKIVSLKYKNIRFGKYLISQTYRKYGTYLSTFKFYLTLFKNIYLSSLNIETANFYLKNYKFKTAYLDHCEYLNGIFYDIFYNNDITVYTNHYPKNIFKIVPNKNKKINVEDCLKIKFLEKEKKNFKQNNVKKILKKIYNRKNNYFPHINDVRYKAILKKEYQQYDYIVYAHSFTDAQLIYGVDGFTNTLEWLKFTMNKLIAKNKKIILKAHPNFFLEKKIEYAKWDKEIFVKYFGKFRHNKNILIIDEPIDNQKLIKLLSKKCIVITHHGTVLLEMIHNNFKVICSSSNCIDQKFKISNNWKNIEQYEKLLKKKWENLKYCKKENFYNLINQMFINDNTFYGKNNYENKLREELFKKKIIKDKKLTYINVIKIFKKISNKEEIINKIKLNINVFR